MKNAISVFRKIFSIRSINPDIWHNVFTGIISGRQFAVLLISILVLVIADILKKRNINVIEHITNLNIVFRWIIYLAAVFSIIIFGIWGPEFSSNNFIYFQF